QRLASVSKGDAIAVWDTTTGRLLSTYAGHRQPVRVLAWSPDGTLIASGSEDGYIHIWNVTGRARLFLRRHGELARLENVDALAWSPSGKYLASGGAYPDVCVWDVTTGELIKSYWESWPVAFIAGQRLFSTHHRIFISFFKGKTLFVHSHARTASTIACSPSAEYIALANGEKTVALQQPEYEETIFIYGGHTQRVAAVEWSPDGKHIASGGLDKTVRIWQPEYECDVVTMSRPYAGRIYALAWAPDGQRLAVGGTARTVEIIDAVTQATLLTYRGHTDGVTAIAWSPDGRRIASASWDTSVQV
ncbi:MAG TPA: WD40 repeat domain-containing protein, partial [Ktedonobacterales bacterium]